MSDPFAGAGAERPAEEEEKCSNRETRDGKVKKNDKQSTRHEGNGRKNNKGTTGET